MPEIDVEPEHPTRTDDGREIIAWPYRDEKALESTMPIRVVRQDTSEPLYRLEWLHPPELDEPHAGDVSQFVEIEGHFLGLLSEGLDLAALHFQDEIERDRDP